MKQIEINSYLEKFTKDVKNSNDIANIDSFIKSDLTFPRNVSTLAIDIGGTNFKIAEVSFDQNGKPNVFNKKECHMPGAIGEKEITSDEFFLFLAKEISNYDEENVGICFSYLSEILENRDARIISFSKEVKVSNAKDKLVAFETNKKLKELGYKERNIKVVNDTVSCLLGVENANMGLILGTGFNICYVNKEGKIINSECGRYKGFPTEDFDFGEMTEQKISGAYLRDLIKKVPHLENEIYDRGSKMIAIEMAGISKFINGKAKVAVEGSVYYNVKELQEGIKKYLDELKIEYELLDGRDKILIGTAVSVF